MIVLGIKKEYIEQSVETIMRINPSLIREDVERIVTRKVKERLSNPTVTMDNNVTGANEKIKLTDLCSWIDKKKPVVSGNATFYMQPDVLQSPTSNMLRSMKKGRKAVKKEMFKYKNTDDEYRRLDLNQGNLKVVMNAEYGASGAPSAAFYTKYSPAATTLMAQSIITTMAAFFEGYIGDNQKFFHLNECFDWMNTILKKDQEVPKWIVIPTCEEVLMRVRLHFYTYSIEYDPALKNYLKNCTSEELVYLYYANNMKSFIRNHTKVQALIKNALMSLPLYEASEKDIPMAYQDRFPNVDKYNKWVAEEMFLNPYNVPDVIKKTMKELTGLITQFCFVEYLTPDSIMKLNNHRRNTVLLVDTDSNVIHADIFVKFVLNELFPDETFSRSRLYNDMICVSMLANIIDGCVVNILDFYGRMHNMNEDARKELTMKNEFMFRIFFLMLKKKRYGASVALREGNIMVPFKLEIKGVDFIKAGVTEDVTKRFTKIIKENLLFTDELKLHELMNEIKKFEREIYADLRSGGVKYLKPQAFKGEGAYKEKYDKDTGRTISGAWALPVFRAATVWNELNPLDKIYSLERVKIIKLIVTCPADIECIKSKYPDAYKLINDKIFNSNNPDIKKAGLKVIAIPSTLQKMPDWIIELIDYDVTISDVISSFRSVLDALKIEGINVKTPNGKANVISSLISI